jgi:hypothetical protein
VVRHLDINQLRDERKFFRRNLTASPQLHWAQKGLKVFNMVRNCPGEGPSEHHTIKYSHHKTSSA